jgi:hypothetical protein
MTPQEPIPLYQARDGVPLAAVQPTGQHNLRDL